MDNFIYKLHIQEVIMPKKMDWLENTEHFAEQDFKESKYEFYYSSIEEMNNKIDEMTKGLHQYRVDIDKDIYGNDEEWLEYHNGDGNEWDKELYIETSRFYLTESFMDAFNKYNKNYKLDCMLNKITSENKHCDIEFGVEGMELI